MESLVLFFSLPVRVMNLNFLFDVETLYPTLVPQNIFLTRLPFICSHFAMINVLKLQSIHVFPTPQPPPLSTSTKISIKYVFLVFPFTQIFLRHCLYLPALFSTPLSFPVSVSRKIELNGSCVKLLIRFFEFVTILIR